MVDLSTKDEFISFPRYVYHYLESQLVSVLPEHACITRHQCLTFPGILVPHTQRCVMDPEEALKLEPEQQPVAPS